MIKNKQHTKLKRLQQMMVRWAEQNSLGGPEQRFIGNIWKKEFKYVLELENIIKYSSLSRIHMIECNKLFREYRC